MQKYELAAETHTLTMVFVIQLCNPLLDKARIAHENTYDMCVIFMANIILTQQQKTPCPTQDSGRKAVPHAIYTPDPAPLLDVHHHQYGVHPATCTAFAGPRADTPPVCKPRGAARPAPSWRHLSARPPQRRRDARRALHGRERQRSALALHLRDAPCRLAAPARHCLDLGPGPHARGPCRLCGRRRAWADDCRASYGGDRAAALRRRPREYRAICALVARARADRCALCAARSPPRAETARRGLPARQADVGRRARRALRG